MPVALLQTELPSGNLPDLFAAFAVTWVVFFAYVFFVSRRQQEMQQEIRILLHILDRPEAADGD